MKKWMLQPVRRCEGGALMSGKENGYAFHDTDGIAKGGLSHANGNCVAVAKKERRPADGIQHYEFHPAADGTGVKGGLSHVNGNCRVVTKAEGDVWEITDSKLGEASPVWRLNSEQFHKLGCSFLDERGWMDRTLEYSLGGGLTYTQTPLPNTARPGFMPDTFRCELTGFEPMEFTFSELQAFQWGYFNGQFPVDGPVREMTFTV